jgi:DNA-binding transcriptional ArsR family regulator
MSSENESLKDAVESLRRELKSIKEEMKIDTPSEAEVEEADEAASQGADDVPTPNNGKPKRTIFSTSDNGHQVIIDVGSMGEIMEEVVNGIKGEIQKSVFVGKGKVMVCAGRGKGKKGDVDEVSSSKVFAALGHEHRVSILKSLATGGMYASEIEEKIPVSASTLSSHLKTLEDAELVVQEAVRGRYLIPMLGRRALRAARGFSGGE